VLSHAKQSVFLELRKSRVDPVIEEKTKEELIRIAEKQKE
jgi:hypothetical protein